jgi:hypothetical protein
MPSHAVTDVFGVEAFGRGDGAASFVPLQQPSNERQSAFEVSHFDAGCLTTARVETCTLEQHRRFGSANASDRLVPALRLPIVVAQRRIPRHNRQHGKNGRRTINRAQDLKPCLNTRREVARLRQVIEHLIDVVQALTATHRRREEE